MFYLIMNQKEFFKPNRRGVILFIVLAILYLFIIQFVYNLIFFIGPLINIGLPSFYTPGFRMDDMIFASTFSFINLLINLIVLVLLYCSICYLFKKKK
jgi:hypothetical protein